MTALMLLEYDLISQNINVETKSVWEIASCVFLGERLGELSGTGAALLAKDSLRNYKSGQYLMSEWQ